MSAQEQGTSLSLSSLLVVSNVRFHLIVAEEVLKLTQVSPGLVSNRLRVELLPLSWLGSHC